MPTASVPSTPISSGENSDESSQQAYKLFFTSVTVHVDLSKRRGHFFLSSPGLVFKDQYLELSTQLDKEEKGGDFVWGRGKANRRRRGLAVVPLNPTITITTMLWFVRDHPHSSTRTCTSPPTPYGLAYPRSRVPCWGGGGFLRSSLEKQRRLFLET